ncbi:MAG: hypothetical protein M1457_12740 [bacterium]|nr:hypothetical protein [bacterium]
MTSAKLALGLGIFLHLALAPAGGAGAPEVARGAPEPLVSLVADEGIGAPARHGIAELLKALRERGVPAEKAASLDQARGRYLIVAGTVEAGGSAARLLKEAGAAPPAGEEALVVHRGRAGNRVLLILCGADDRGLMYAALDAADRIGWASDPRDPLSEVRETAEWPDVRVRALSAYTMQRAAFEQRFYNEDYWARYFDMMARNRFNSFTLIFGYENGGFLAPCYPYFFDVDGFPQVRMVGLAPEQQRRNLAALNRMIEMAHERGIGFTVGIWDHIYRAGVQTGGLTGPEAGGERPTPGLVWGVTADNLNAFTAAALDRLLVAVPALDALQFRMHGESGLKPGEIGEFWTNVFQVIRARRPDLRFDARAKELPDSVIDAGLRMGIKMRICTKYWMEQMGMPFHPTHINVQNQHDRRHGYADLLRYPRRYSMLWRLWNGGTTRVMLWGDPDYARRFARSAHLYDGDGYEVNEPLATKMEAQPHDEKPFDLLTPRYRSHDYEFERYWHFFQVFGRLGYNPATPEEVWMREFERRFGSEAAPFVAAGLHRASWVLPRIVAAVYPYTSFPMTRGWAERQRLGDLPAYAMNQGSDIALFASFDDEARRLLESGETAMVRPQATARWFDEAADDIERQAAEAEARIGDRRGPEFEMTMIDLRILAGLARFHSRRIPAAISYDLFRRTHDPAALDDAIAGERRAVEAWRALAAAAGDAYAPDLKMGLREASLCGHWRDELQPLEAGLARLEQERRAFNPSRDDGGRKGIYASIRAAVRPDRNGPGTAATADRTPPVVRHTPVTTAPAGQPITISAEVSDPSGVKWVRLRYRTLTQFVDYSTLEMKPVGEAGRYEAVVPAAQIDPQWDFMYYIEAMDSRGNGRIHPDFEREAPYVVVRLKR